MTTEEFLKAAEEHHENTWFGVPLVWTEDLRNKAAIAERSGISARIFARIAGEDEGYKVIRGLGL